MRKNAEAEHCNYARIVLIRVAALFLTFFFSISIAACSEISEFIGDFTGSRPGIAETEEAIENSNFIRLIALGLSDPDQIITVYSSIPHNQLDGMSQTEFEEYIGVLRRLGEDKGGLLSFKILKDEKRQEACDALSAKLPSQTELVTKCVPVKLEFEMSLENDSTLIFFQERENGSLYLSAEWVRQCIELYRFSELYFSALQNQNVDAVYSMIRDSFYDRDYSLSDTTIRLKAQEMCRFYLLRVKTDFNEYRISSFDITKITFDQQGVLDDELIEYEPRVVQVQRNEYGGIVVNDVLTNTLKIGDLYLYANGGRTVRIGDYSNNIQFEALFGDPVLTTISRVEQAEADDETESIPFNLTVDYPTARIRLLGNVDAIGEWEGTITQIQIGSSDQDFSIGNSIRVGMTLEEFMAHYPFADETNFILGTETDEQSYRLRIRFSQDAKETVSKIVLETEITDNSL
ncbi:MAG: hypothetical protein JW780_00510 [Clostridiales bacterium]|nr:hypothetical protein [Clostridiales bacterium]